jgi:hypothetical protein
MSGQASRHALVDIMHTLRMGDWVGKPDLPCLGGGPSASPVQHAKMQAAAARLPTQLEAPHHPQCHASFARVLIPHVLGTPLLLLPSPISAFPPSASHGGCGQ